MAKDNYVKKADVKDQHDSSILKDDKFTQFFTDLRSRVEVDDDNRESWKAKMVVAYNQRQGIKRISNRPYPGAPNIPTPETDKIIKKTKPAFILSALSKRKKALIVPRTGLSPNNVEEKNRFRRAEKGLNHILNNKLELFRKFMIAADNAAEKGHCVFKIFQKYEKTVKHVLFRKSDFPQDIIETMKTMPREQLIELAAREFILSPNIKEDMELINDIIKQFKSDSEIIEFDKTVINDLPNFEVRPPEDIIVPTYSCDIEEVERLSDDVLLTIRQLEEGAECGKYNKETVKKLKAHNQGGDGISNSELLDDHKDMIEGINDSRLDSFGEQYKVRELYFWYKKETDKHYKRYVVTYLPQVSAPEDSILAIKNYPFSFDKWNFIKHDFEIRDRRYWSSRGVPEMIRGLQEVMDKAQNNLLIRDEINNAPLYTVLNTSKLSGSHIRFIPGQKITVNEHGEIARLDDMNRVDQSSERIGQLAKASIEEYMGSTDQLFRNATNAGGGKTLGEIQTGIQQVSGPMNLDILNWFITLQKLYTMIFELMADRVGEPLIIDGEVITNDDFKIDAVIYPNGDVDMIDRNTSIAKANQKLQVALNLPETIVTAEDHYNAAKEYFEMLDENAAPELYITSPEEIAQSKIAQLTQQVQQLQAQAQMLDEQMRKSTKDLGKTEQKTTEIVDKTKGKIEAMTGTGEGDNGRTV